MNVETTGYTVITTIPAIVLGVVALLLVLFLVPMKALAPRKGGASERWLAFAVVAFILALSAFTAVGWTTRGAWPAADQVWPLVSDDDTRWDHTGTFEVQDVLAADDGAVEVVPVSGPSFMFGTSPLLGTPSSQQPQALLLDPGDVVAFTCEASYVPDLMEVDDIWGCDIEPAP